ncbi:MAG: hypothetical protein H6813_07445 [Phycisphaeraceae bacterium]|nr:hypothetical protein [Phycisphaeraceae bacterium]MCB9848329.1 hypothetical protein [Phycisphaeraceae bacterium]
MCRRSDAAAWLLALLALAPWRAWAQETGSDPGSDPDAAIEAYLESHGLRDLLVTQLENRIDGARGAEKTRIVEQLATIYAEMLEAAGTSQERIALVERGRALLARAPEAESADLRLGLDRASFTRAERLAERARLLIGPPEDRQEAEAVFASIAGDLSQVARATNDRVRALERQEESAGDFDPELLSEALGKARRTRSMSNYLAGWSKAYLAEMNGDKGKAIEALTHFGWLLNAPPNQPPTTGRIPTALLEFEHVARSVIGSAVCEAALGETDKALAFLDVLEESDNTPPAVRAELAARRMTILARGDRWLAMTDLIDGIRGRSSSEGRLIRQPMNAGEARLLGVLSMSALERIDSTSNDPARSQRREIEALARLSLEDLAARNELGHMLDLTLRFGVGALGEDGFIARHVRGLRDYQNARAAHEEAGGASEPTSAPRVIDRYRRARTTLRSAYDAPDAAENEGPRATDAMLIGLCLYYASGASAKEARLRELDEAATWLVGAAEAMPDDPARQSDALSMAIQALDTAEEVDGEGGLERRARRDEIAMRFLERFPEDHRAGALLVKLATSGDVADEQAVALLQRVPESAESVDAAHRLAARKLYALYRSARPNQRQWAALRYADAAEPLLLHDRMLVSSGDAQAVDRVIVRGRRLLDALLSLDAPDIARAQSALDLVRGVLDPDDTGAGAEAIRGELRYRQAQIALASGSEAEAQRLVEELRTMSAAETYRDAAARLLHKRAVIAWRDAKRRSADPETIVSWARRVVDHGGTLLLTLQEGAEGGSTDSQTDDAALFALRATIAEATADLWRYDHDAAARDLSIGMHKSLLDVEPGNQTVLRRLAELAEEAGDAETALDAWRRLVSGLAQGSDDWFEARLRQMTLLARVDRARAIEAMRQHRVLWPDWGPEPWGERFADLDRRLEPAGGAR